MSIVPSIRDLLLAVILAPFVAVIVLLIGSLTWGDGSPTVGGAIMFGYFFGLFAYGVTIVVGLPLFLVLGEMRRTGVRLVGLGGLVLGLATPLVVNPDFDWSVSDGPFLAWCGASGLLAALVFRWVALGGSATQSRGGRPAGGSPPDDSK